MGTRDLILLFMMAMPASVLLCAFACRIIIPVLRRHHIGQHIYTEYGPAWHAGKQGTPTMGGVCFIIPMLICPYYSVIGGWVCKYLFEYLRGNRAIEPVYGENRKGDIPHSYADISKAEKMLKYQKVCDIREGLALTEKWYSQK